MRLEEVRIRLFPFFFGFFFNVIYGNLKFRKESSLLLE